VSEGALLSNRRAISLIGRGVYIELVRRKDFQVLFMLMSIFVAGVLAVRVVGIENAATATFLLNLGMTLASIPAHILTLLMAARAIPDEIENRTIYPLLAKPVRREAFVAGKWLAASAAGVTIYAALTLLAWLPVPKLESYAPALLGQAIALQACSLVALAAFAMMLSLLVPRGLAVAIAAGVLFLGDKAVPILVNSTAGHAFGGVVRWLALYVPDFSKLNLITRYTDGIPALAVGEFAGLAVYAAILSAFFLAVSMVSLRRRML
jgi:ABC-type transport system involved in multi-copper enzyme maturation permease subunit